MDLISLLAVPLCICSILIFFYVRASSSSSSSKSPFAHRRRLPPGPRPLPVVGSLLELGDSPHRAFARLAAGYGPLISLRLGRVTTVVASSPDAARDVLQKHDAAFSDRSVPDAVRARGHHRYSVPWLPPARRWRRLRGVCTAELFTPQRLDAQKSLRHDKIRELRDYVSDCSASSSAVDVGRAAFATSLNLLSRTIFSVDLVDLRSGSSSGEFKAAVEEIMVVAGTPNISDFFPGVAALDLQGKRRRMAVLLGKLHRIFDEQIDRRLRSTADAGESPAQDFLSVLLKCRIQEDDGPPTELDRPALRSLFTDLFAAGSDTSSNTVEWAMAELLRSPRSMAAAREELARVIGPRREVEESDVAQLLYLQAVVKETLRLHPPAPFLLPRRAVTDVEVGGCTIPADAQVLVNVWAMGRDPAVWARPEEFAPERFLNDAARDKDFRGKDFDLLPFGAGRRICPGLPLAARMVHLMLAALLHGFDRALPDGGAGGGVDMTGKFGVTLAKAVPLRAMAAPA
ncbi:geraniol 8-hydroxylase-like [Ananas comosus]|uniref:Geraniol 8-hydroxylase-like n=1 Tax=Ananas comosus TaxID=4615 RepID=A0A6P5FAL9_ANACO|nr:geraniol 8-hydroxylase-like [Ananas comosus]